MAIGTARSENRFPSTVSGRFARTLGMAVPLGALAAAMFVAAAPVAGAAGVAAQYDGTETADTVRVVVGSLIAIAVVTAVLLAAYVWHTSPRRRQRLAAARRSRSRDLVEDVSETDVDAAGPDGVEDAGIGEARVESSGGESEIEDPDPGKADVE